MEEINPVQKERKPLYGINLFFFTPAIFDYYYWWSTTLCAMQMGQLGDIWEKGQKAKRLKKRAAVILTCQVPPRLPPMQHSWPSFNYSIYPLTTVYVSYTSSGWCHSKKKSTSYLNDKKWLGR